MKTYNLTGNLSIFFGLLSLISCFSFSVIFYGLITSFIGFVVSVIHIFIASKLQIEKGIFSKGYIGMFLSSTPVLMLLISILILKD